MTVFKFTGQWIIAKNIDTIMGLQATATKRKLELDDVNKAACQVEDRCQDEQQQQQQQHEELNVVDEVDGSVSPPKITKYESVVVPEATSRVERLSVREDEDEEELEFEAEETKSSIKTISDKTEDVLPPVSAATVQELTNECKSTYISHHALLHQPMIVEDSIAKLEAVAVPGEIIAPWTAAASASPVSTDNQLVAMDSISRLQAVAVPDEGADGTRSALATTLLSSDDLCDDDDDDFDDDFDDDDHLPPRYHHCPPAAPRSYGGNSSSSTGYSAKLQSSPPHSYYMDYPQLCGRPSNGQPQGYGNRVYNWHQGGYGGSYEQQQQQQPQPQQTIRCAENGKSYLELGSSNSSSSNNSSSYQMNGHQMNHHQMHRPAPSHPHHPHYHHPSFNGGHPQHHHPHHHHHQHPQHHPSAAMKRCCDGRPSTWCQSNNKQCYKDRRMSMLNLSMFKLSRFRQVSEQSLYRSVLICNTLKQIEREIEIENKEAQAAARQQQHQQQQMHLHAMHQQQMHHMQQQQQQGAGVSGDQQSYSNSSSSSSNQSSPSYQQQRQTTSSPMFSQQPQPHHSQLHPQLHHQMQQQQQQHHFQSNTDGVTYQSSSVGSSSGSNSSNGVSSNPNGSLDQVANQNNGSPITGFTFGASSNNTSRLGGTSVPQSQVQSVTPLMPFNDSLPPYDHPHPLRDTASGRATPFPSSTPVSDTDSGFGDEDCTRPINWGSVLSLSSQSALDPLAGSDLFATGATGSPLTPITPTLISSQVASPAGLPPTNIENGTSTSSAHLKVLSSKEAVVDPEADSGISMMDDDAAEESTGSTQLLSIGGSSSSSSSSSLGNVLRPSATSTVTGSSEMLPSWLDMESELTELLPSWKLTPLSAEDILKSMPHQAQQQQPQPMEPTRIVHEASEMETGFTHIMVVS